MCELGVGLIASQICKMGPFENEGAEAGETVVGCTVSSPAVDPEIVVWNASGSIESIAENVGKVLRLSKQSVDFVLLSEVSSDIASSQFCQPVELTETPKPAPGPFRRSCPASMPPIKRIVVSNRLRVPFVLSTAKLIVGT